MDMHTLPTSPRRVQPLRSGHPRGVKPVTSGFFGHRPLPAVPGHDSSERESSARGAGMETSLRPGHRTHPTRNFPTKVAGGIPLHLGAFMPFVPGTAAKGGIRTPAMWQCATPSALRPYEYQRAA
eukprot:3673583-Prymnesium_polylepis.2